MLHVGSCLPDQDRELHDVMSDEEHSYSVCCSLLPLCGDQDCPKATDLASTNAELDTVFTALSSIHRPISA